MSKKNVVLAVLLLSTFAAFVAAITALLLGHPEVFTAIRDIGLLAAIGAAYITIDLLYKEADGLREERDDLHQFNHMLQTELAMAEETAELNNEAFKEVSRDAREAWEEVERLRAELAKAEASAANGWKDAGDKWAQLLQGKQEMNDLQEKVKTLEAWIASPPATPEDIIW